MTQQNPSARYLADATGVGKWTREKIDEKDEWSIKFEGNPWFVIKESTIEDAGYGLFAARGFNPTNVLGRYTGVETTREEIDAGNIDDSYVLEYWVPTTTSDADGSDGSTDAEKTILIDANPKACGENFPHVGWVHMMNDARVAEKINVFFTSRGFARTTKNVSEGDELFVSYGLDYWCHEGWTLTKELWISTSDARTGSSKCDYVNEKRIVNSYKL